MSAALVRAWYRGHPALLVLLPLAWLYGAIGGLRRLLYRSGWLKARRFPVPVVVIGNVTAGGTGKTPLTLALIEQLRAAGFRPGVVSRGYGGQADYPLRLGAGTTPAEAGDEPVMLFRRAQVPLVVDPRRSRAVQCLLESGECDVVLCDDGLQHYALARDLEIAVVDGARGLGNGRLLPAGPLREPKTRLYQVDQVVVNGAGFQWPGAAVMQLQSGSWQPVAGGGGLSPPAPGSRVHAVAGIGNPERFFAMLRQQGFEVVAHAFPDHHDFSAGELDFADSLPVVMTEKDMVKCRPLARPGWWYVPVQAELPAAFFEVVIARLRAWQRTTTHAG